MNVVGSTGQLMSVTDEQTGVIYQIGDISGIPIWWVNSNGVRYSQTISQVGISTNVDLVSFNKLTGTACYFDYRVSNSGTGAYRAGVVMAVWDGTNIEYTDTSTPDLIASTLGIEFTVSISGDNVVLSTTVTTGTWDVKIGTRAI